MIDVNPVQYENVPFPMLVIEFGIVKEPDLPFGKRYSIVLALSNKTPSTEQYLVLSVETFIEVRFSQEENALLSMFVTELGIVIVVNPLQHQNALFSILITELGIMMEIRLLQYANVLFFILVTELGITIEVSPLQP